MDIRLKYFILFAISSIYLFLVTLLWQDINLPFDNTNKVIGVLTLKNINPLNDTLRFFLFTGPIFVFSYLYLIINFPDKFYNVKSFFLNHSIKKKNFYLKDIFVFKILFILFIIFEFLSIEFSDYILLDSLHDGDFLTPLKNYETYKGLWSSSFVIHGGRDFFIPIISSKIFENYNIAAIKFSYLFCILVIKFLSIILCFQISKISTLPKDYKIVIFVISTIFFLSMSSYDKNNYINLRDLFVILFFIFFTKLFLSKKNILLTYFLTLSTIVGVLYHYDTGIYLCLILLTYLFYLLLQKNFKEFSITVLFFFINSMLGLLFLGSNEIVNFFEQIGHIINNIDKIHGLEYPTPFFSIGQSSDGARATKMLLFFVLAGFFINFSIMKKNKFLNINERALILFFYLFSLISFKNALGRSDGGHIMLSSDWISAIIFYYFLFFIFYLLSKRNKNPSLFKYVIKILPIMFLIVILINFYDKNIHKSLKEIKSYVDLPNSSFKSNFHSLERSKIINEISKILKNEKCINNFTVDLSLPYLLGKPSCSRFFSSWIVSGKKTEFEYIKSLKEEKSKYIIYFSPYFFVDQIPTNQRLTFVETYIKSNYSEIFNYQNYLIMKKR